MTSYDYQSGRDGATPTANAYPVNPRPAASLADRSARLVARSVGTPIAMLVQIYLDHLIVTAAVGLPNTAGASISIDGHSARSVLDDSGRLILADASRSTLACALSTVSGAAIGSMLGITLEPLDGQPPALLLAIDSEPRDWTPGDLETLTDLAAVLTPSPETPPAGTPYCDPDLLLESIGEGLYSVNGRGECEYMNHTGARLLGYEPEEIVGRQMHDLIHHSYPDGSPFPKEECQTVAAVLAGESPAVSEQVFWRKDGTQLPVEVTISPILDGAGGRGAVINFVDITERKQQEENVKFFKHIVDSVGESVVVSDENRRITYANRAAEEAFGWTLEDVAGQDIRELIPDRRYREKSDRMGAEVRQTGKSRSSEFMLRRTDGSTFPALVTITPVDAGRDEQTGAIGIYTDITELKQSEENLRFHKHIIDAVGQAVIANDNSPERRITYWNEAAEHLLGWTADEAIGRGFYETVPAREFWPQIREIGKLARAGQPWQGEIPVIHKDGDRIPSIASVAPILDDDSELLGVIAVFTDATEVKRNERDIRFYKHVVEAVGQVVIANDLDRNVTYWNQTAEEVLGWKAEEVIGQDTAGIAPAPEFLPNIPEITKVVRAGKTWTGEFLMQHRNGTVIPALSTIKPIFDEAGELIGVLGAHTDIRAMKQTEQELRFHKHIVDAVGQAVVVSDRDGRITYWNRAAEEIYGWSAGEAVGQYSFELLSTDAGRERASEITAAAAAGETWSGEFTVRRKSGNEFPAYFTVTPVHDADREIIGVLGISHDISERKAYERQIEFHKVMLDAVGQTIVATDTNRVITYWSKGAEQALGWDADDVLGRPIAEIAPAAHLRDEAGTLHRRVREGETWLGEFPIRRKDGSTFPAVVSLAPIHIGEDNQTAGVIGVYTDVTELKETEQQLRIHKDMLDAVGQAVLATDESLRVTYWNRAAEELYGYATGEAIGMHLMDLLPGDSPGFYKAHNLIDSLSHDAGWTGEMTTRQKDGAEVTVLISATPISNEAGDHIGVIAAMADITQRRQTEEALKDSNAQVVEILETMGDGFLSVDQDWCISYVNQQAERFLRRDRDMILGRNVWEEFPGSNERAFFQQYMHALESGEAVDFTEYYPELDAWFEVHAFPSGGQLSIFFRDVTRRITQENALREAERRYRTLVEQLPAVTYIAAPDDITNIRYVSPQIERMLGYTPDEWLAEPRFWMELLHPDDRGSVRSEDEITNSSRESFTIEYRQRSRSGEYRWIRDSAALIRDENGNARYWQGLSHDITDEKAIQRQIHESEQHFRSLFDHHPDAVFSIDRTGRVLTANPAFIALTGRDPAGSGELRFVDLVLPDDCERVKHRFSQTHQGESQAFHATLTNRQGERTSLSITTIPIIVDGEIVGVHVVAQDVTVHQELENQLAHQAFHDALTGLPNRNLFQNRLVSRIERLSSSQDGFAVLFFDLDDFKVINDSLGHSAGDQLLIQVAERVQTCIRDADLLARLGGDEFTLLLERVSDEQDAVVIAERIAQVLDESFTIEGHEVFVTTSIGIALGDVDSQFADDVLRNADMAMYEAKNAGKNRYARFEPSMNSRAWLRLTLETELRRGLERDEFDVLYQPIIDLTTGELDGVEALVRWEHPKRGTLLPEEFISVAEQSGLILPLGRKVVERAIAQLPRWQAAHPEDRPLRMSINLSSRQYQHPRLVEELTETIEQANVDPALITMEITESIAMDDSVNTLRTLQRLKDIGVQLALDDFGTGFSAMSYLRRFPIDIIKIDQSFVNGLGTDPEDTSIVEAVMAASLAMRLQVTAEGIETSEQLEILLGLGCRMGQGYLISPPLSADQIRTIVEQQSPPWCDRILDTSDRASD